MRFQIRYIAIIIFYWGFLLSPMVTSGQNLGRNAIVKTKNLSEGIVGIKWFVPTLFLDNPVNVYRQEIGSAEWVKINSAPIVRGQREYSEEVLDANEKLLLAYGMNQELKSTKEVEGLTKYFLLTAILSEPEVAYYLGIQYNDSTASVGKSYRYKVVKTNKRNKEEDLAVSEPIKVGPFTRLALPSDIRVDAEDKAIGFHWLPEDSRYWGVNIYMSTEGTEEKTVLPEPIIPSKAEGQKEYADILFREDSLQNGTTYKVRLTGVDFFGYETESSEVFEVTPRDLTPPPSPEIPTITQRRDTAVVAWELTERLQETEDLAGFYLYRTTDEKQVAFQRVSSALLPKTDTIFYDVVPRPGRYFYQLASVDISGNENFSESMAMDIRDVTPPSIPTGLTIAADTGRLILNWTPNPEVDILGYVLFRQENSDKLSNYSLLNADPMTSTEYIQELPENTKNKFYYRIAAVDSSYNRSELSEAVYSNMPDVTPPVAPFVKVVSEREQGKLSIEWMPSTDADLSTYKLFRNRTDTVYVPEIVAEINAGITDYADDTFTRGLPYEYYLQAVDSSGNISVESNRVGVNSKTLDNAVMPSSVQANYSSENKKVNISFQAALTDALGFSIHRSDDNKFFRPISGLIKETSFEDAKVKTGNTYYYQVRTHATSGKILKSEIIQSKIQE